MSETSYFWTEDKIEFSLQKILGFKVILYGDALGLLCAIVWAVSSLIIRTQSFRMPATLMNSVRCGVATLLFWGLLIKNPLMEGFDKVLPQEWALLYGSVILGVIIGDTLFLRSIKEIGVSRTMAIVGTVPLTTLFFQQLLLDIPVGSTFIFGCVLVVGGVICLSGWSWKESGMAEDKAIQIRLGILLSLSASLLWGLSTTMLKPALSNLTSVQANSVRMPLVALVLFGIWHFQGKGVGIQRIGWRPLLIVASTGLIGMGLGSYLYLMAIDLVGPAKTATLSSVSPVFSLVLEILFLKEKVTTRLVLGVGLCLVGVWIVL